MPTVPALRLRRYRLFILGLALSLLFHFVLLPEIVRLFGFSREVPKPEEFVYQVRSSSLTLARKPKPEPARPPIRPQPLPRPQVQHSRPAPVRRVQPPPKPQHRELAKIEPHARVSVPKTSSQSIDFARQEQQFEKTIAQLRRESNPVVSAARPVQTPEAPKVYSFDFRGSIGTAPRAEGILSPVNSWRHDGYDYYYVRYWVQYADGTTETGYVPWPIRYRPGSDPFALHWQHFPLPAPLPDYVLPAGTAMHPLVAFCYEHRYQFSDCPIAHD